MQRNNEEWALRQTNSMQIVKSWIAINVKHDTQQYDVIWLTSIGGHSCTHRSWDSTDWRWYWRQHSSCHSCLLQVTVNTYKIAWMTNCWVQCSKACQCTLRNPNLMRKEIRSRHCAIMHYIHWHWHWQENCVITTFMKQFVPCFVAVWQHHFWKHIDSKHPTVSLFYDKTWVKQRTNVFYIEVNLTHVIGSLHFTAHTLSVLNLFIL